MKSELKYFNWISLGLLVFGTYHQATAALTLTTVSPSYEGKYHLLVAWSLLTLALISAVLLIFLWRRPRLQGFLGVGFLLCLATVIGLSIFLMIDSGSFGPYVHGVISYPPLSALYSKGDLYAPKSYYLLSLMAGAMLQLSVKTGWLDWLVTKTTRQDIIDK